MMKAYTFYTESHQILLENWLKQYLPQDLELVCVPEQQKCATGNYMTNGWYATMLYKIELIRRAIDETWGGDFLYVDADIQFFGPVSHVLRSKLQTNDIVAQQEASPGQLCAGLFACRSNEAVRAFWDEVYEIMIKEPGVDDQEVMNRVRKNGGIRMSALPVDLFWSNRSGWHSGQPIEPPQRILVHHANYTVGVKNKLAQLEAVRRIVEGRNGKEFHGSDYGGYHVLGHHLSDRSTVYSVGIGEDATFDLSLIEKYGVTINAFDPTPRSIEWVNRHLTNEPRFHFSPIGILDQDRVFEHYFPPNPNHVSCSRSPISKQSVALPMQRLKTAMRERGHASIDLLKLDIEGAECDVVDDMLASDIHPRQLLIEFHARYVGRERITETQSKLRDAGYVLFSQCDGVCCFSLNRKTGMTTVSYAPELWNKDRVITEKKCYELLQQHPLTDNVAYYAIPWATIINKNLELDLDEIERFSGRSFTVCQHIKYATAAGYCQQLGIDVLFTPHASSKRTRIHDVEIRGFLHFPCVIARPDREKDILFSFVGDCNTHSVRKLLGELKGGHIMFRHSWHFWSAQQQAKEQEYKEVLERSVFSLCPRGTGLGSIRFGESLLAGAIPVLIADDLALPEGVDWSNCVIRVPEQESAIREIPKRLRALSSDDIASMRQSLDEAAVMMLKAENYLKPIRLWSEETKASASEFEGPQC